MMSRIWIQVKKLKRKAGSCLHSHYTYNIAEASAEDTGSSWGIGWSVVAWGPQTRLLIALSHDFTLLTWSEVTQLPYWSRLWASAADLLGLGWRRLQRITQKGGYRFFRAISLVVHSWLEKHVSHPCLIGSSSISNKRVLIAISWAVNVYSSVAMILTACCNSDAYSQH